MKMTNLDSFPLFLNKQMCMANPAGNSCTAVVSLETCLFEACEVSTRPSPSKFETTAASV